MDDLRVGVLFRAARRRRRLRQLDVAEAVGVSQQTVSRIERGRVENVGLRTMRTVGQFLGISVPLDPHVIACQPAGPADARHLEIVQATVRELAVLGWRSRLEYTFNHYGERGSIDVLAWRSDLKTLLIVEAKSAVVDVQELIRASDVRERVVPGLVAKDLGWRPRFVGYVVVLPSETATRDAVNRYASVFDSAFPDRTVAVRRRLRNPVRCLRALRFLELGGGRRVTCNPGSPGRIRKAG